MDRKKVDKLKLFKRKYLKRLIRLYSPSKIIVFDSWARGDAWRDSDLDVIIVSEKFRGIRFISRASNVLIDLDIPFGMELLCYTPEEFEEKKQELGIVRVAVEEGIELACPRL